MNRLFWQQRNFPVQCVCACVWWIIRGGKERKRRRRRRRRRKGGGGERKTGLKKGKTTWGEEEACLWCLDHTHSLVVRIKGYVRGRRLEQARPDIWMSLSGALATARNYEPKKESTITTISGRISEDFQFIGLSRPKKSLFFRQICTVTKVW